SKASPRPIDPHTSSSTPDQSREFLSRLLYLHRARFYARHPGHPVLNAVGNVARYPDYGGARRPLVGCLELDLYRHGNFRHLLLCSQCPAAARSLPLRVPDTMLLRTTPRCIPVQTVSNFELVINLKTAKA